MTEKIASAPCRLKAFYVWCLKEFLSTFSGFVCLLCDQHWWREQSHCWCWGVTELVVVMVGYWALFNLMHYLEYLMVKITHCSTKAKSIILVFKFLTKDGTCFIWLAAYVWVYVFCSQLSRSMIMLSLLSSAKMRRLSLWWLDQRPLWLQVKFMSQDYNMLTAIRSLGRIGSRCGWGFVIAQ